MDESRRTGLGVELMAEVDEALMDIGERPRSMTQQIEYWARLGKGTGPEHIIQCNADGKIITQGICLRTGEDELHLQWPSAL